MKSVKDRISLFLTEAPDAGRAWDGRLKRIDALMSWLYDKDILTKGEKAEKDRIFRAYYRYYNDGDWPSFLSKQGFSKYSDRDESKKALEKYLNDFIKKILGKYMSKIDRTEFRIDNTINHLKDVQMVASNANAHGLLTYWLTKTEIKDNDGRLATLVTKLNSAYKSVRSIVDAANPKGSNKVLSYLRDEMKGNNTWTSEMERGYAEVEELCHNIANFIGDLIAGLNKLKTIRAAG